MAGLFHVLRGEADGTFQKAAVLNGTDDEPLIIPIEDRSSQVENICTRPFATDWDADGDLDLVVGNFAGTFYLFTGEGEGRFLPKPEQIMAGDRPLRIEGAHSDPFMVDWDADGDLDLLSGSSQGGIQWAENLADAGQPPRFERFRTLIEAGPQKEFGDLLSEKDLTGPAGSTRVWVDDIDADGKLDLLVGDCVTLISPADGVSEDEFKKRFAEWKKEFDAALVELSAESEQEAEEPQEQDEKQKDEEQQEQEEKQESEEQKDEEPKNEKRKSFFEIYNERSEFMDEQRTGFVWFYRQK